MQKELKTIHLALQFKRTCFVFHVCGHFFSSAARFLHCSDTLFVMSVMTNSHELPCISFFPLTPFVTLSRPLQFLQFVTMVTVACRFLLVPVPALVSAICKTLFCQEQLLQDERKKVLIVSLHTRVREQTDKFPLERVLLTLTDVAWGRHRQQQLL